MTNATSSALIRAASLVVAAAAITLPVRAQAWWRGGVFIGVPPVVVGPPAYGYPAPYYPPPAYYPPPYYGPGYAPYPPPAYAPPAYAQPPYAPPADDQSSAEPEAEQNRGPQQTPAPSLSDANTPFGSTCYAGNYVCPASPQTHVGTSCSCPGLGAPSFGVVQ